MLPFHAGLSSGWRITIPNRRNFFEVPLACTPDKSHRISFHPLFNENWFLFIIDPIFGWSNICFESAIHAGKILGNKYLYSQCFFWKVFKMIENSSDIRLIRIGAGEMTEGFSNFRSRPALKLFAGSKEMSRIAGCFIVQWIIPVINFRRITEVIEEAVLRKTWKTDSAIGAAGQEQPDAVHHGRSHIRIMIFSGIDAVGEFQSLIVPLI